MTEPGIIVRRCTVTVVRRGAWSWGPAPDRLPDRVLAALYALLADAFAERFADELAGDEDVEVTEPVRLDLRLPLAALAAGAVPPTALAAAGRPPSPASPPASPASARVPPRPDAVRGRDPSAPPVREAARAASADAARLLAAGVDLDRLLRLLPPDTIHRYRALLAAAGAATSSPAAPPAAEPSTGPLPDTAVPPAASIVDVAGSLDGEVEVASALPFLVAAALQRVGLLGAIGPVLAGAGLDPDAPLLATALGYQVLGPLERGWRRAPADRADAAAFAGLAHPPEADAVDDFVRRAAAALPVLDGLTGLLLCRGHEPGRPLLVATAHERHGGGLLLVEPDGLFPIAWVDETAGLLPYWEASGYPPVLVAGASLGPGAALAPVPVRLLDALAETGMCLVCDAPPVRGQAQWRRLPGSRRLWATGDVPRVPADLATLTGQLDELVDVLAARWAVPLARGPGLGRTVALFAALGLGTLAWQLWRYREPPDPQLALARLGDLGAVVRFAPHEVSVRLPLGRRYHDLRDRGLLGDVDDVAWLDGRTLTFTGG